MLTYSRWYSNSNGGDPANDIMVVDISDDGGLTWVNLETVGPAGSEVSGGWIKKTFRLSDYVTSNNNIKLRFDVSDLNGGSVIEAGLDALEIRMVQCAQTVTAFGAKFLDGVVTGGSVADINQSDNQYLEVDPSPTSNLNKQIVDLVLQAECPVSNPTALSFRVEGFMAGGPAGDVILTVQFKNELTGQLEVIDYRVVSDTEQLIEITATGDVSRFVHPLTNEITAQVTWRSSSFSGAPFVWSVTIDQIVWLVSD